MTKFKVTYRIWAFGNICYNTITIGSYKEAQKKYYKLITDSKNHCLQVEFTILNTETGKHSLTYRNF